MQHCEGTCVAQEVLDWSWLTRRLLLWLPARLPAGAQEEATRLKGSPCQLVAAETSHADGPRSLYILQRWLPLVLHIRRECLPQPCRCCFVTSWCCCHVRGLPMQGVKHADCPRPYQCSCGPGTCAGRAQPAPRRPSCLPCPAHLLTEAWRAHLRRDAARWRLTADC